MLPDTHDWLLFMAASLILLVTPGPAVLYVVTRSMSLGTTAGLVSAPGLVAGGWVHVAAAVLGLSAILAASDLAYAGVKLAGAAGQMLTLGLSFLTLALITDSGWALAAGRAGRALEHPRFGRLRDRVAGAAYVGLGAAAALTGRAP